MQGVELAKQVRAKSTSTYVTDGVAQFQACCDGSHEDTSGGSTTYGCAEYDRNSRFCSKSSSGDNAALYLSLTDLILKHSSVVDKSLGESCKAQLLHQHEPFLTCHAQSMCRYAHNITICS